MESSDAPPSAVVIDASVWISRLLPQDSNHQAASSWVNRHIMIGGIFTAPTMLAMEVAASISRRTKNVAQAQAASDQLYGLWFVRLAPMEQTLVEEATDLAATLGLRGADAIYVALAMRLGVPLVSFDSEQLTRPSSLISTIRP